MEEFGVDFRSGDYSVEKGLTASEQIMIASVRPTVAQFRFYAGRWALFIFRKCESGPLR